MFWVKHPDSEQYLKTWYDTVLSSVWKTPSDVKKTFSHASILKNNTVVFNIKGNKYLLITKINYEKQWIFVKFPGTHDEYNDLDADMI